MFLLFFKVQMDSFSMDIGEYQETSSYPLNVSLTGKELRDAPTVPLSRPPPAPFTPTHPPSTAAAASVKVSIEEGKDTSARAVWRPATSASAECFNCRGKGHPRKECVAALRLCRPRRRCHCCCRCTPMSSAFKIFGRGGGGGSETPPQGVCGGWPPPSAETARELGAAALP